MVGKVGRLGGFSSLPHHREGVGAGQPSDAECPRADGLMGRAGRRIRGHAVTGRILGRHPDEASDIGPNKAVRRDDG